MSNVGASSLWASLSPLAPGNERTLAAAAKPSAISALSGE
jgi:hypothetical protein